MDSIREIVVLSGKGGTGKTSVASSLAYLAGKEAILADCDVDASNLHLIMGPDIIKKELFYGGEVAQIDIETCIQCGKCKEVCRFDAISFSAGVHTIDNLSCEGCGYCSRVCPTGAITMMPRLSGEFYISGIRNGSQMSHAKLFAGGENSGKLVAIVKKNAYMMAKERGCDYLITDGAPGIGCPVVSSLSGAKVALLVTEPTMSALHDLKRVLFVVRRFNAIPLLVINKSDINEAVSEEIKKFAKSEKIEYLADIPFNTAFVESMGKARIVAEENQFLKGIFESVWEKAKEVADSSVQN